MTLKNHLLSNNFFGSLHVLVHAAETATASLFEAEGGLFENVVRIYDVLGKRGNLDLLD